MASNFPISKEQISKAREALDVLSALSGEPSTSSGPEADSGNSNSGGILQAANKALGALNRIRAGTIAEERRMSRPKHEVKRSLTSLFKKDVKRAKTCAWKHTFVCLALKEQDRIPTTDTEKDELYEAGLGVKEVKFTSLNISAQEFREVLMESYPKLKEAGGFLLFKCAASSRKLEPLSKTVYSSPANLKERVGSSRTYIRPVQRDLDLQPITELPVGPEEECLSCGMTFPIEELTSHVENCEKALAELTKKDQEIMTLTEESRNRIPIVIESDDEEKHEGYFLSDDINDIEEEKISEVREFCNDSKDSEKDFIQTPKSLSDAVKLLQSEIFLQDEDDFLRLEVRRSFLFKDALRESKKKKFNPKKFIKVSFTGEGAIDNGGPRREFFRLLASKGADYLFVGPESKKYFDTNITAIQKKEFYYFGQYIAMSIAQGGYGFPYLSEAVYWYMTTGKCDGSIINASDLPNSTLTFVIEKINGAESNDELKRVFDIDEAMELLVQTGFRKCVASLTLNDISIVSNALVEYHCMIKVKEPMDQFRNGLKVLGLWDMLITNPVIWKPLFVCECTPLTAEALKNVFKQIAYSEPGSKHRSAEEQTWINFADFLDDCEAHDIPCKLEDILVFFSGTDKIPPLGFDNEPVVIFLHDLGSRFPTASTCSLQLRLPISHGDNYALFKEDFMLAIFGNDGFGGV